MVFFFNSGKPIPSKVSKNIWDEEEVAEGGYDDADDLDPRPPPE